MDRTTIALNTNNLTEVWELIKKLTDSNLSVNLSINITPANSLKEEIKPVEMLMEEEVRGMLQKLGIPPHLKGWEYLYSGILIGLEDVTVFDGFMTKIVYPRIARQHNSTPTGVERCVRVAIDFAWSRNSQGFKDMLNFYDKPYNGEFMACVSKKISTKYQLKV